MDPSSTTTTTGGFLSSRRIKLTSMFPMIVGGGRRAAAAAVPKPSSEPVPSLQQHAASSSRNRMRRGSSLTDLNRSDSLAGTRTRVYIYIFKRAHTHTYVYVRDVVTINYPNYLSFTFNDQSRRIFTRTSTNGNVGRPQSVFFEIVSGGPGAKRTEFSRNISDSGVYFAKFGRRYRRVHPVLNLMTNVAYTGRRRQVSAAAARSTELVQY